MEKDRKALIISYLKNIKAANKELTKKELFKDLLHRLYAGEKEIEKLIDAISAGSEYAIINIPRKDKRHKGSADTLYNRIIIEFENNLKVSFKHAKEQLAGYMLGQFNSGEGYNYTLIASDFINWKVVVPDVSQLDNLDNLNEHELILNEAADASFALTESNAEDFYYWIDRFLFKEEKQKASLKRIEAAFGYQSSTFIESYRQVSAVFDEAKKYGEVQVSYEQWRKFLSIAYVDTKAYAFYTDKKEEAYYLTAILNSTGPNERMKDFQSRGLFGARDVHKKILDIYYPKFEEANETHQQLALSQTAHEKASQYLKDNVPKQELSAIHLGRLRVELKNT